MTHHGLLPVQAAEKMKKENRPVVQFLCAALIHYSDIEWLFVDERRDQTQKLEWKSGELYRVIVDRKGRFHHPLSSLCVSRSSDRGKGCISMRRGRGPGTLIEWRKKEAVDGSNRAVAFSEMSEG